MGFLQKINKKSLLFIAMTFFVMVFFSGCDMLNYFEEFTDDNLDENFNQSITINAYTYYNNNIDNNDLAGTITVGENTSTNGQLVYQAENDDTVILNSITNQGYVFDGWYSASQVLLSEQSTYILDVQTFNQNNNIINIYAHFSEQQTQQVTITFFVDSYSISKTTQENNTLSNFPSTPIKEGYIFIGWNTQSNGNGVFVNESTVITQDITVYAVWQENLEEKFYIYFEEYGGQEVQNIYIEKGEEITLPIPTKENYIFDGWYDQPNGTGNLVNWTIVPDLGENNTITVLYAKWDLNLEESFTLTINYGDGTNEENMQVDANLTFGEVFIIVPNRVGYNFDGWYTQPDGLGQSVTSNTVINSNITVYGNWVPKDYLIEVYAKAFNDNYPTGYISTIGGTVNIVHSNSIYMDGELDRANLPYNTSYLIEATPNANYNFIGWYTDSYCTNLFSINSELTETVQNNLTLYARFEAEAVSHTITFDSNNGSYVEPIEVLKNTSIGNLMPEDPVRSGYNFDGWYTSPYGAGTLITQNTVITQNDTFYANWINAEYIVTLDTQGGINSPSTIIVTYENNMPSGLPIPTKQGYMFMGYYQMPGGQGIQYYDSSMYSLRSWQTPSNGTIYAYWTLIN